MRQDAKSTLQPIGVKILHESSFRSNNVLLCAHSGMMCTKLGMRLTQRPAQPQLCSN
jgi:hypothetical protein